MVRKSLKAENTSKTYSRGRHLVITIHGIRTYGDWQERLEKMLGDEAGQGSFQVLNYKYGYFSILAFIVPLFRWLVVRKFRSELVNWCSCEKWSRVDIVGHSFGTHVLAWALYGIPADERPIIHTIVLAGSVLPASFPWRDLVGSNVERVVNDCGSRDKVLIWNQLVVLFTGMAGRTGFSGTTHGHFRNRFFVAGHSGFFVNDSGKPDNNWMRQYWLPLFTNTGAVKPYDERPPPTAMDGIIQTLANNAEPIKLIVYIAPVMVVFSWIFGLYTEAESQRVQAEKSRNQTLLNQSKFLSDQASRQTAAGDATTGLLLSLAALPDTNSLDKTQRDRPYWPAAELRLNMASRGNHEIAILKGHKSEVTSLVATPDGARIVTGSKDGTARIWDANSATEIALLKGHKGALTSVAMTSDGRHIVSGSEDNTVRVWNAQTGVEMAAFNRLFVRSLAVTANGGFIVTGTHDDKAQIWKPRSVSGGGIKKWHIAAELNPKGNQAMMAALGGYVPEYLMNVNVAVTPDGARIVTSLDDKTARIWDPKTGDQIAILRGHDGYVTSVALTPDGTRIITGSKDGTARIWELTPNSNSDTKRWRAIAVLSGHTSVVTSVAVTSNGARIVTGSEDNTARVWELQSVTVPRGQGWHSIAKFGGHESAVTSVAVTQDGARVFTGSKDGTARIWAVGNIARELDNRRPKRNFTSVAVASLGTRIVTGSSEGLVRLLDAKSGTEIAVFKNQNGKNWSPAVTADGLSFFTVSNSGDVHIWSTKNGAEIAVLKGDQDWGNEFAPMPDGSRFVTGSSDGTARIWNASSGSEVAQLKGPTEEVSAIKVTPDGSRIVILYHYGSVRIWDANTREQIAEFEPHKNFGGKVVVSLNGTHIATSSEGGATRIWDTKTATVFADLKDVKFGPDGPGKSFISPQSRMQDLIVTPDGNRIITRDNFGPVRVWDSETGTQIAVLEYPKTGDFLFGEAWSSLAITPDGSRIITSSGTMIRVWRTKTGEQIDVLKGLKGKVPHIASTPDRSRIIAGSLDGTVSILDVFPTIQALVNHAKAMVTRCLTQKQRKAFYLAPSPSRWCITGAGGERARRAKWEGKWPYHTATWQQWLEDRDAGKNPPIPGPVD